MRISFHDRLFPLWGEGFKAFCLNEKVWGDHEPSAVPRDFLNVVFVARILSRNSRSTQSVVVIFNALCEQTAGAPREPSPGWRERQSEQGSTSCC